MKPTLNYLQLIVAFLTEFTKLQKTFLFAAILPSEGFHYLLTTENDEGVFVMFLEFLLSTANNKMVIV